VIEADDALAANDESNRLVPNKLHIRGLDTLHTDDIKAYVKAHFGFVDRVEWIDDTSANLVFHSEPTARDALAALALIDVADVTALSVGETLPAKPVDGKPEIALHVRFAVEADRKQAGAAMRSRYYLLHPEHDPEERRRQQQQNRSRYRDREYRRGDGGGRRRRDEDDDEETVRFDASMYDDVPRSARERRRSRSRSASNERRQSYARENRGKELFAGHRRGRGRSASPARDHDLDFDGDADMDGDRSNSRGSGNRAKARSIRERLSLGDDPRNDTKELFPTKSITTTRRGGGQLDQLERAIGSAHLREEVRPKVVEVPSSSSSKGGFSIRGAASQRSNADGGGFSIKGAAASAKELFPDRFGANNNSGKELLNSSRSKRPNRQRAEDLFG
jgi:hypothetical protein